MPFSQPLRKNSHILWTISLIQDIHPDAQTKIEFNEMTEDVISNASVETVTLCLAVELQRFRFMILENISETEALKKCEQLKDQWHQDNPAALKKLQEAKKVLTLTWKEFLAWPQYEETMKAVQGWYESSRDFRHDVDGRIRQELENTQATAKLGDIHEKTKLLKQYLFEECAFQKFASTRGFAYELYKTPMNKAMRRVKKNTDFVPPGVMTEIYFTQFAPSHRNASPNSRSTAAISSNQSNNLPNISFSSLAVQQSAAFAPIFSQPIVSVPVHALPIDLTVAEFIEKTLRLVPVEMRVQAIEKLLKFTLQEILPLSCVTQQQALKV